MSGETVVEALEVLDQEFRVPPNRTTAIATMNHATPVAIANRPAVIATAELRDVGRDR